MTHRPRAMERRRFVQIVSAAAAAVITAPWSRLAAAAQRHSGPPPKGERPSATAAMRKEIRNQERTLGAALRVIRDYELPPGSPMAFVFTPLRARRRR